MNLGIAHPVPLAMHDVVTDLHVLEDLRHRGPRRAHQPGGREEGESRTTRLPSSSRQRSGQNKVARCLIEVTSVPGDDSRTLWLLTLPLGMAFTVMDSNPSVEVLCDVSE